MEIKIGVEETPRELTVSSEQTADEIEQLVVDALNAEDGVLRLNDDKGRKFLIPAAKIAYVEVTPSDVPKVGFAVGG